MNVKLHFWLEYYFYCDTNLKWDGHLKMLLAVSKAFLKGVG